MFVCVIGFGNTTTLIPDKLLFNLLSCTFFSHFCFSVFQGRRRKFTRLNCFGLCTVATGQADNF